MCDTDESVDADDEAAEGSYSFTLEVHGELLMYRNVS